jgi:hypothetical protein
LLTEFICIGIPSSSPTLGYYLFAVDIYLDIAGIIQLEMVLTVLGSLNEALVDYRSAIEANVLRQILDTTRFRSTSQFRGCRTIELEIDRVLISHHTLAIPIGIGSCEMTLVPLPVVDFERATQLLVLLGIAPTTVAV